MRRSAILSSVPFASVTHMQQRQLRKSPVAGDTMCTPLRKLLLLRISDRKICWPTQMPARLTTGLTAARPGLGAVQVLQNLSAISWPSNRRKSFHIRNVCNQVNTHKFDVFDNHATSGSGTIKSSRKDGRCSAALTRRLSYRHLVRIEEQ